MFLRETGKAQLGIQALPWMSSCFGEAWPHTRTCLELIASPPPTLQHTTKSQQGTPTLWCGLAAAAPQALEQPPKCRISLSSSLKMGRPKQLSVTFQRTGTERTPLGLVLGTDDVGRVVIQSVEKGGILSAS